jgi:hypothetical protein
MSNASSDEAFVEIEAREVDDTSVDKPLEADCGERASAQAKNGLANQ